MNEKKREKTHELTAASHLAFMSRKALHAHIQEKRGPPSVCERERVSVAPTREREESVGKLKKMNQMARAPAARADLRKEGTLLAFVSGRGPVYL